MLKNTTSSIFWSHLPLADDSRESVNSMLPQRLQKAAPGRIEEYLGGRYCAFMAAKAIGITLSELEMSKTRAPIWPDDLVGSISHTKDFVISAVSSSNELLSIGIDAEKIISCQRRESVQKLILRGEDKELLAKFDPKLREVLFTLIFSAKESLYKLLFPFCQCYFDFQEAFLTNIDLDTNSFIIKLISEKDELKSYKGVFSGQFYFDENRVITLLELEK